MSEKKYAFEGRYHKWFKIPVYITFPKLDIQELEDGSKKYLADGVPSIFGRNKFYDKLIDIITFIEVNNSRVKIFLAETFNYELEPQGFYFTIEELVEVED